MLAVVGPPEVPRRERRPGAARSLAAPLPRPPSAPDPVAAGAGKLGGRGRRKAPLHIRNPENPGVKGADKLLTPPWFLTPGGDTTSTSEGARGPNSGSRGPVPGIAGDQLRGSGRDDVVYFDRDWSLSKIWSRGPASPGPSRT